jgi:hypothetical protein
VQLQSVAPETVISHSSPAPVSSAPLPHELTQVPLEHTRIVPHAPVLFRETHALLLHRPSVHRLSNLEHCTADTHSRHCWLAVHTPPVQAEPAAAFVYAHCPLLQLLL